MYKILLCGVCKWHYFIDQNKGHQRGVATPECTATSRMGESIYKFSLREIPGAFLRAWNLEKVRLERVGKGVWSLDNEIIPPLMITLAVYTVLVLARSEARRVGHACVSTCISRGSSHIE